MTEREKPARFPFPGAGVLLRILSNSYEGLPARSKRSGVSLGYRCRERRQRSAAISTTEARSLRSVFETTRWARSMLTISEGVSDSRKIESAR
jgi:hypothetical protein